MDLTDWSAGSVMAAAAALFAVGFVLRKVGITVARKEQRKNLALSAATEQIRGELVRFQAENAYLPAVPVNLWSEYDGWFEEALKRVRLRSVRKTRAEQLALAQQAEELGRIYHSIVQNQQNVQETVLAGTKRRGELQHDIELQPLEKKKRRLQLQYDIEALKVKLRDVNKPGTLTKPSDRIEAIRISVKAKLARGTAIGLVKEEMIRENPEMEEQIVEMCRKMLEDEQESW
jgi:hypothetical protein